MAFILAGGILVIDIGCLLYLHFAGLRVIPQEREAGAVEREVAGEDIGVVLNQFNCFQINSPLNYERL